MTPSDKALLRELAGKAIAAPNDSQSYFLEFRSAATRDFAHHAHPQAVKELLEENERLERLRTRLQELTAAVDAKACDLSSDAITGPGDPEIGYQTHAWHEEWLHYVRRDLAALSHQEPTP